MPSEPPNKARRLYSESRLWQVLRTDGDPFFIVAKTREAAESIAAIVPYAVMATFKLHSTTVALESEVYDGE